MGYEPHSKRVWYRRGASGVRTTLRNMYGTGEGPLVYKPHSETCSVQEMGLWGTNRTPKRVRYRRGASGVRTTLRNMCGTGEGPLGYELLSGTCVVQERGLWGTNRTRNVFGTGEGSLGYELLSETCSVQERGLWGTERIQRECRYKGDVIIRLTITILTEIFDNYEELQ